LIVELAHQTYHVEVAWRHSWKLSANTIVNECPKLSMFSSDLRSYVS